MSDELDYNSDIIRLSFRRPYSVARRPSDKAVKPLESRYLDPKVVYPSFDALDLYLDFAIGRPANHETIALVSRALDAHMRLFT